MNTRFWTTFALLLMTFIGTLWLETGMRVHYMLELYLLLVGVILAIILLFGIASERSWAPALGIMLFAALLANGTFVYLLSRLSMVGFALIAIFSILGMILAVSAEDVARALHTARVAAPANMAQKSVKKSVKSVRAKKAVRSKKRR